jgi:hypothetical protein
LAYGAWGCFSNFFEGVTILARIDFYTEVRTKRQDGRRERRRPRRTPPQAPTAEEAQIVLSAFSIVLGAL